MRQHSGHRALTVMALACLLGLVASVALAAPVCEGDVLQGLHLPNSPVAAEQAYLGVGNEPSFPLESVKADVILFEFFGVYCPICHEQAPDFNRLVKRINRSSQTRDRVKVLGLATGATDVELEHAREAFKATYPLLNDPDFSVHKILGEPKTPFTLLLRPDGTVLWAHLGRIEDPDALYQLISSFL